MKSNVAHIQTRLQLAPRPKPGEKLNKSIKIGETSFMVCETTHLNISDLADELRNTHVNTIRYVLDKATPSVLDQQRGMVRIDTENYGPLCPELQAAIERVISERKDRGIQTTELEAQKIIASFAIQFGIAAAFVTGEDLQRIGRERK